MPSDHVLLATRRAGTTHNGAGAKISSREASIKSNRRMDVNALHRDGSMEPVVLYWNTTVPIRAMSEL